MYGLSMSTPRISDRLTYNKNFFSAEVEAKTKHAEVDISSRKLKPIHKFVFMFCLLWGTMHTHPHKSGCWARVSWDEDTSRTLCGCNQWDKDGNKDLFHRFLRMGLRLKNTEWHSFKPVKENTLRWKINITCYELKSAAFREKRSYSSNKSCQHQTVLEFDISHHPKRVGKKISVKRNWHLQKWWTTKGVILTVFRDFVI